MFLLFSFCNFPPYVLATLEPIPINQQNKEQV
ncbi:hypothetical protein PoMZ_10004 [Pyricularia oryzae]|uniref:Uncharacterized protein n=1 Tax=Pyricularia oryzae TaxID=318829 RepID=A0A4P7MW53_PYROR|nr:hypothetical protein PoMZ_10004 [Pyricularia oryzae]